MFPNPQLFSRSDLWVGTFPVAGDRSQRAGTGRGSDTRSASPPAISVTETERALGPLIPVRGVPAGRAGISTAAHTEFLPLTLSSCPSPAPHTEFLPLTQQAGWVGAPGPVLPHSWKLPGARDGSRERRVKGRDTFNKANTPKLELQSAQDITATPQAQGMRGAPAPRAGGDRTDWKTPSAG